MKTVAFLKAVTLLTLFVIAKIIEYSPVLTTIPARRESIPIYVCKIAVTTPDIIPAPIATSIERYGCPLHATVIPTNAPSVKQLSVDKSHTLSIE